VDVENGKRINGNVLVVMLDGFKASQKDALQRVK
jgi:hypothetical protein